MRPASASSRVSWVRSLPASRVCSPLRSRGNTGVFVFEIEDIAVEDKQNAEAEKVRMQAMAENMAMQASFAAIQQMAEVQDLRAKYF